MKTLLLSLIFLITNASADIFIVKPIEDSAEPASKVTQVADLKGLVHLMKEWNTQFSFDDSRGCWRGTDAFGLEVFVLPAPGSPNFRIFGTLNPGKAIQVMHGQSAMLELSGKTASK